MSELPSITPNYAPQSVDVPWPTEEWPRGTIERQHELERLNEAAFAHDFRQNFSRKLDINQTRAGWRNR